MEYIAEYLAVYFSNWQNKLFWSLVLIFCLYEAVKKAHQKRNYIKLWMKEHNIGRKYK